MSLQNGTTPLEIFGPVIQAFAHSIRPAFPFLLIAAMFSAVLIPLLLMLFALSTSRSRRQPIFILNICTIVLGLILGALWIHTNTFQIESPLSEVNATEVFVLTVLSLCLPLITEAILIFRVVIVYTPAYSSHRKIVQILAFPVVVKVARTVLTVMFLVRWRQAMSTQTFVTLLDSIRQLNDWIPKATWILELMDNAFIAALFLWLLAARGNLFGSKDAGHVSGGGSLAAGSFANRLKTLFWIASTNLIFPLVFNVMKITIVCIGTNILLAATMWLADVYVGIIFTAFATIWSSTYSFKEAHQSMHLRDTQPAQVEIKTKPMIFFDPSVSDAQSGANSQIPDSAT